MQQSDYILREIEKISVLLMGLLGKLTSRKKEGSILDEDTFNEAVTEFENNIDFQIDTVLAADPDAFDQLFRRTNGFDERNTELIADLLVAMGEISIQDKKPFFEKALEIYDYLDRWGKTYSVERAAKSEQARFLLEKIL